MRVLDAVRGLGFLLFTVSCGPTPAPETTGEPSDPAASFAFLETRLTEAREIHLGFHITSEGAFTADLEGELDRLPDGSVRLAASGEFGGESVRLQLVTKGGMYEFGNGAELQAAQLPPHLSEALFIGMTRMGLLHNLANLVGDAPPDGGDGGVREWVVVDSFGTGDPAGASTNLQAISFAITVAGTPSGSASLELDEDRYPAERRQLVRFPGGEMRVVERYFNVFIDP